MRRLTTWLRSEKCVVRRFRRCAKVIECTYTNLDSIAYYTPSRMVQPIVPRLQTCTHVTVLNTVGNCNTVVL